MRFRSVIVATLMLLAVVNAAFSSAAPAGRASAQALPPVKPVVLVLGDSLSAGFGIPLDQGWVSLLKAELAEQGSSQQVLNASISGDTTAGGLSRLPALLEEHRPSVLIIALGANDGLRGFPPSRLAERLTELIELAQGAGARVLLAGVRLPPNYGEAYADAFQAAYARVAAATGVALVPRMLDGVSEDRALMQPDGLHPTAEAQPRILDNLWPALEPLLGFSAQATGAAPHAGVSAARETER